MSGFTGRVFFQGGNFLRHSNMYFFKNRATTMYVNLTDIEK